ncbi:hypothetical protein SASPL_113692 [Salvia splendens]|uniref:Aldehyde decarbonylase n=1 Tax=Salvia splendens TaxID=180675 RepID=A0A8X8XZC6_SALSN|nr:hypothetical protein SASPL_113692 [Salvia splendens]
MATKPGMLTDWPWKPLGSYKYMMLGPWAMHSLAKAKHELEDDQILLNGLLFYFFNSILPASSSLPVWRTDGVVITALLHAGPIEYLYYWLHRALHHHYLYSRYHSHHHSSIVTEPISFNGVCDDHAAVIHPFAEHIAYYMLFGIPLLGTLFIGVTSLASLFGYITYIDFMNNMGHCNFEFIPKWLFSVFPPLKYFMYTPSFHSLHHSQFRTNYSLFMPLYDYIHGTTDRSSDALYESSLERLQEIPDVVHLTHLTTPESIFHLRLGFASFASRPHESKWSSWPLSWLLTFINGGSTFLAETNMLGKLKLQTWTVPRYSIQSQEVNRSGEFFIERHPQLKTKVVDGSSLAVAIVLNSIPTGTTEILFRGALSKLAFAIVSALLQRRIQVATFYETEMLKLSAATKGEVAVSKSYTQKVWIVGDGLSRDEQVKAPKGTTLFIPFSHFPPKKERDDASYCHTPSMIAPSSLQNLHSCENWLPRRVLSAARIAGILHALEGWDVHECGDSIFDVDKIWEAAIRHGFRPTTISK